MKKMLKERKENSEEKKTKTKWKKSIGLSNSFIEEERRSEERESEFQ